MTVYMRLLALFYPQGELKHLIHFHTLKCKDLRWPVRDKRLQLAVIRTTHLPLSLPNDIHPCGILSPPLLDNRRP